MNLSKDYTKEEIIKIKKDRLKNKYKKKNTINKEISKEYKNSIFGYNLDEMDSLEDLNKVFNKVDNLPNNRLKTYLLNMIRKETIKKNLMDDKTIKIYFKIK